ncbi:hypothetical protein JCM10213_007179 [Rhodosporidiobolus nylandii]
MDGMATSTEQSTNLLISLFAPFPPTLSLALPSSTPLSTLASHLSRYAPLAQQSLSYASGRSLPAPSATLGSLAGAAKTDGGFVTLRLGVRLPGGKGGFASQLRAQGGRMSSNKAQNTDSCRGLDGRRLSTMKEAQKLAALLASEPDRLAAAAQQKQAKLDELNAEIARLERAIGAEASASSASTSKDGQVTGGGSTGAKRRLDDQKYVEESREIIGGVKDAVRAAMLKKRKKNKPAADSASSTSASTPASSTAAEAKENAAPAAEKGKEVKGKGKATAVEPEAEAQEEGEGEKAE